MPPTTMIANTSAQHASSHQATARSGDESRPARAECAGAKEGGNGGHRSRNIARARPAVHDRVIRANRGPQSVEWLPAGP